MTAYPDTSFLWALYVRQSNSTAAAACAATLKEPLPIGELLRFEFQQSLRFQSWRHAADPRQGINIRDAEAALRQFQADLDSGVMIMTLCSFPEILERAESLSTCHTPSAGHRSFDILHVATALVLGAKRFLTFDANQRRLALAEGLDVNP